MCRINRFAAASALAAAFSMAATPAMAREHGWRHWHHHDRIEAGDVIAGAVILGGIAAIASAASKHDHDEQAPPPAVPSDRQGYSDERRDSDVALDRTADTCVDAVERGRDRVDSVDDVSRGGDGWTVSGVLANGADFTCLIGNDGRVADVHVAGSRTDAAAPDDGGAYRGQEQDRDDQAAPPDGEDGPPPPADNRPEWRGDNPQPLAPDSGPAQQQDDGRYDTSQAPDFGQAV
jgi:hypothetical protein